jgi:CheY-like chemotaxis protein
MLAFTDTGHGMDAETRAQIFDPFFTTKESGKGTGLGLATVHGIVAQSGGDIWVYSEPSYGTTFKLYFPMVQPEATTAASAAAVAPLPTGTETILLVDDDPMVRTVTRRLLDRYSYQIIEAADGPQALYIMQAHETPIHLLLTDLVLSSDMNGRQLAEQVQTGWPETRVLYMSGYTDNVIGQHGILSADTFFLQKPFSTDELLGKIRAALQGETTSSAALHQSIPGNRPVTRNGAR